MDDLAQSRAWRASRLAAKRYRESANAVYAWEAAGHCLAAGLPLPAAVLAYVTRAAQKLGAPAAERIANPAAHVFRCLEIAGPGPSAFERRRRFERDLAIQQLASAARRNLNLTRDAALELACKERGRDPESLTRQVRRRRSNPPLDSSLTRTPK